MRPELSIAVASERLGKAGVQLAAATDSLATERLSVDRKYTIDRLKRCAEDARAAADAAERAIARLESP